MDPELVERLIDAGIRVLVGRGRIQHGIQEVKLEPLDDLSEALIDILGGDLEVVRRMQAVSREQQP